MVGAGLFQRKNGVFLGIQLAQMTGSSQRRPLFLRALSLYGITKSAHKYHIPILILFKIKYSSTQFYLLNCVLGFFTYLLFIVLLQKAYSFRF